MIGSQEQLTVTQVGRKSDVLIETIKKCEELTAQVGRYRRLLKTVANCNNESQLLYAQKMVKEELSFEETENR